MKWDVVLLTEKKYIDPKEVDWYTEQVLTEDGLVQKALEAKGFKVCKKDWADPEFDWSTTRLAIFRSIWDYFKRFQEFSQWLDKVEGKTTFINPIKQIKWNVDKHYLLDLEKRGIRTVPSYFIEKGDHRTLEEIHIDAGWTNTVIKPTVSGAARHTYRLNPSNYDEHEDIYQYVIEKEAMILQPFQKQIMTKGEVSHIVIGGKYTHSILKKAKDGDYRVQDDWGGTVHEYEATSKEKEFAESVVLACDIFPTYARVDLIWDNDDNLAVSELELIEPELWFRNYPKAAEFLANEIEKQLKESL